jgi:hypothetical protein
MNVHTHTRQGIPLRPAAEAISEMAMTALTRACIATVASGLDRNVRRGSYVRDHWGDEAGPVETVLRAATSPAMTTQAGWAKELATVSAVFLRNLVPYSAGADLLGRVLGLSFDGAAAINLPAVTVPLADFVAEGAAIPVVTGVAEIQAVLTAYKFAVITVLSRETIEGGNAESLVRAALLESTGPALDRRLFDANPGVPDLRPPGLLYGITPLPPAAVASGKTDAMQDDLQALITSVAPVAGNGPIIIITSPAQAVAVNMRTVGTFSYSVLTSNELAPGTVIAVAANAIVSASGDVPLIDTTRVASVVMDDAPGAIMSGGRVTAMFQTDTVGLRLRWPLSWATRDARGIAVMTGVNW